MNKVLDANAVLRYMLNDIEEQADIVEKAIRAGACTIPEVLAEVVYVLSGVYSLSRTEIIQALNVFLKEIEMPDKPVVLEALDLYGSSGLDYVDCVLAAKEKILKEDIITFDRKLKRLMNGNVSDL